MEKPIYELEQKLEDIINESTQGLDHQPFFYAWDHVQTRWRKASVQNTVWDPESETLCIAYIEEDSHAPDLIARHTLENWSHGAES